VAYTINFIDKKKTKPRLKHIQGDFRLQNALNKLIVSFWGVGDINQIVEFHKVIKWNHFNIFQHLSFLCHNHLCLYMVVLQGFYWKGAAYINFFVIASARRFSLISMNLHTELLFCSHSFESFIQFTFLVFSPAAFSCSFPKVTRNFCPVCLGQRMLNMPLHHNYSRLGDASVLFRVFPNMW